MNANDILLRADTPALLARFETHFIKPRARLACWEWQAAAPHRGYGRFSIGASGTITASRAAWVFYTGRIPDGAWVLHSCDNPPCVNPRHLFLGDHLDNMHDRTVKLRGATFKLTVAQVREARRSTLTSDALARKFGVSRSSVAQARSRRSWAWLD